MRRIQIVDIIRSISIILVMGQHLFLVMGQHLLPSGRFPVDKISFSLTHFSINFSNGRFGVALFFVVSGYLITEIIVGRRFENYKVNFKDFYTKRVARIFPLFFVIIFTGWLMLHFFNIHTPLFEDFFNHRDYKCDSKFWFSLFLLLFNWTVCLKGEGLGWFWTVLWSLAVEEQFYLSYPWVLKKIKKLNNLLLFLGAVILGGLIYRIVLTLLGWGDYAHAVVTSFGSFDQIAIGSLLYFVSEKWKDEFAGKKSQCAVLCAIGLAVMLTAYINMTSSFPTYLNYGVIFGPFFISAGCFLFLLGGFHLRFFESRYLRWLTIPGQLSYGCYLWHFLVIFMLFPFLKNLGPFTAFMLIVLGTVLFAYVSYAIIERPANHLIRKRFGLGKGKSLSIPGLG